MSNSYLGSRVSLISKSLIRYEGILYSIDAKESTIALSRVRFWGTENRPAEKFVPMREEVYDYIIFRACDIRDLIVDPVQEVPENETFEDPAIVQAHLFSASGDNQQAGASGAPAFSLGSAPSAHAPSKPFNGNNPTMNNVAENVGLFNGHSTNPLNSGAPVSGSAFEFHSRGSSPPSNNQRSPLPEQQQNGGDSKSSGKPTENNNGNDKAQVQKNQQQTSRAWQNNNGGIQHGQNNHHNQDRRPRNNHHNNNNNGSGNNYQFNHNQQNNRRQPGSFIQPHHGSNQFNRNNNHHHNNNGNNMVGGFRRNQNGPMQQNGGPRPRNQQLGGRPIIPNMRPQFNDFKRPGPRKFDPALKTDFDFEKANQEFQELEHKLGKLNVSEPEAETVEEEKTTEVEEPKSGDEECYDKKKSFFDKISCEALERSKGKVNKVDWKHERKLNSETFGLQSNFRRPNGYNGYRNNYGNRHNGGNRYNRSQNNQNNNNSSSRPVNA